MGEGGPVLRVLCIRIQQHMACQRTARLLMAISLPALHGCSAWLLCFLPPCSPSPPHDMVVVKRRRGRGQPCASRKISTQMCAPTRTGCRVGDAAGCSTHAHTRTHAVGGHPFFHTTTRRRSVATDMASLCGVGGGVGHWQACMAWWPSPAAQLLSMVSTCAMPPQE